ncbi:hypothetical protein Dimus_033259 [Dionaea muscipula]
MRSKSGAQFGFMRFDSEVAARLAVLKVDGLRLKDKFLRVKKVTFGRNGVGLRSGVVESINREQREERHGGQLCGRRGNNGVSSSQLCPAWVGQGLSHKVVLQGGERAFGEGEMKEGCEHSSIVITGESHEIGRVKGLLVFDSVEGFNKALSMGDSWWGGRGVKMTPWSPDLWGDVLVVEFDGFDGESGSMDEGRVQILTEIKAPFNFVFLLIVDKREFVCRVMEDPSASLHWTQGCSDQHSSFGPQHVTEIHRFHGLRMGVGAAMADFGAVQRSLNNFELCPLMDRDKKDGLPMLTLLESDGAADLAFHDDDRLGGNLCSSLANENKKRNRRKMKRFERERIGKEMMKMERERRRIGKEKEYDGSSGISTAFMELWRCPLKAADRTPCSQAAHLVAILKDHWPHPLMLLAGATGRIRGRWPQREVARTRRE